MKDHLKTIAILLSIILLIFIILICPSILIVAIIVGCLVLMYGMIYSKVTGQNRYDT